MAYSHHMPNARVKMYYGVGQKHTTSLQDIGEYMGITKERVRQIREKAIRKLRHSSKCRILKTYLG